MQVGVTPVHALGIADVEKGRVLLLADVIALGRPVAVTGIGLLGVCSQRADGKRRDDNSQ